MKARHGFVVASLLVVVTRTATAQPVQAEPPPAAEPAPPAEPAPAARPQAPPPEAAPPGAAAAPAPLAPNPPPPPEAGATQAGPTKLTVGNDGRGFFQPSALLQFWVYGADEDADETFTFRIRRAELRVKGEIIPDEIAYQLMIDPARALELSKTDVPVEDGGGGTVSVLQPPGDPAGPVTILQDYFITFMTAYADASVGQFKIPVSLEGFGSSSKLLFPERALVSRAYGDKRELGLRVQKKLGDVFFYSLGLFNGSGQNRLDDDIAKDAALRLEVYPFEGLTLAAAGYTTIGKRETSGRDRLEVDARYDAHDLYLIGEYIHAWQTQARSSYVEGHGAYLGAGYTLFKRLQPIARVGFLERDLELEGDRVRHYEGGLSWLLGGRENKLTVAIGHYVPAPSKPKRTDGTLAAQVSF